MAAALAVLAAASARSFTFWPSSAPGEEEVQLARAHEPRLVLTKFCWLHSAHTSNAFLSRFIEKA